jgi:hypothetical protein
MNPCPKPIVPENRCVWCLNQRLKRRALLLAFVAATFRLPYAQQTMPSGRNRLSDVLTRIDDPDLHTREAAFADLMTCVASEEQLSAESKDTAETLSNFFARRPQQANEVKLSLIKLLKTEDNTFVARTNAKPGTYTEEDGEYYAQVIDTVSSLDDERVIPALVGAITTGGMAQRGLLKYGDKALVPVLDQLKNPDALVRATALGTGIKLLEKHNDLASHVHITDLILSSLRDSDGVVRGHAVREIDCLADREDFLSALQQIAKADPDKLPGKSLDGGDGDEFYPVRYDARRVLRDIQNGTACNPEG